jgi:glycosyltransferase involved in cell wall biosynthesis
MSMAILTVIVPSYNRAEYINECLDSIFAQQTNYVFHVVVADDASTDNTVEIVKQYQKNYPDKISLLTSEKNQRLFKNVLRVYKSLDTKYFTVLDPDDYWTDNSLIQKSLDFLETHSDFTIYCANITVDDTGNKRRFVTLDEKIKTTDSTFEDYLAEKSVLSCTQASFYRNAFAFDVIQKMEHTDERFINALRGDAFRNILHLHAGKAHFVNEIAAVYRVTETGIWQSINQFARYNLNSLFYITMHQFFDYKYPSLLIFAYRIFNRNRKILFDHISGIQRISLEINDVELDKFMYMIRFFLQNPVEQQLLKLNRKTKAGLKVYQFLQDKLLQKGLI